MDTLVLSASWEPVQRVPWQRAVALFFKNKVTIVEEYEDRVIRSQSFEMKIPSIVRFVSKFSRRHKAVRFSRENIYARDHGRCQYCGHPVPRSTFTYDHVTPRSQGGKTTWENVVVACMPCNQRKKDKSPSQAGMRMLSTPVKPQKLPNVVRLTLRYENGMPVSWKAFLRDVEYWHGELEEN